MVLTGSKRRDLLYAIVVIVFWRMHCEFFLIKQYRETARVHESDPVDTYGVKPALEPKRQNNSDHKQ